jgi:hypothetical protein
LNSPERRDFAILLSLSAGYALSWASCLGTVPLVLCTLQAGFTPFMRHAPALNGISSSCLPAVTRGGIFLKLFNNCSFQLPWAFPVSFLGAMINLDTGRLAARGAGDSFLDWLLGRSQQLSRHYRPGWTCSLW